MPKREFPEGAYMLVEMGFTVYATKGTAETLQKDGGLEDSVTV